MAFLSSVHSQDLPEYCYFLSSFQKDVNGQQSLLFLSQWQWSGWPGALEGKDTDFFFSFVTMVTLFQVQTLQYGRSSFKTVNQ